MSVGSLLLFAAKHLAERAFVVAVPSGVTTDCAAWL